MVCGIFPDQGLNPRLLHWHDFLPLSHQGSPIDFFMSLFCFNDMTWEWSFIFCSWIYNSFSTISWKDSNFYWILEYWPLNVDHVRVGLFLNSLVCSIYLYIWQPSPVFLPGESQGRWSLVGCRLWGCTESDTGHDWSDSAAVILMAISHPLDYFSYNKSQNQVSWVLPTLFFYKIVLAILDPLHFFINLELACQFLHKVYWGTPLVVQQLRLYTFNAGGMDMGSISGWELRICMLWGQKKKSLLRFCLV